MPTPEFQASPTVAFQLDDIVRDAMAGFAAQAKQKAIAFAIVLNDLEGMTVVGDPQGLSQVLSHLCEDAVTATDCGHVHLVIERLPAGRGHIPVRLAVTDTGNGSRRDLTATKLQVERMGGEIFVSTTTGRGSTVFVLLPFGKTILADV